MPPTTLTYRPYHELGGEPHVVVDGSASEGTVLVLSHWPGTPAPRESLRDDLSAQMAFRYLDHDEHLHGDARFVTNNHFDQDGLVGVAALVDPEAAMARRALLEDLAAAGDFGTYRHRAAARASMVVSAATDPDRSPFAPLPESYDERSALLYDEMIGRLPDLVDDVEAHRAIWADEDAALSESEAAIEGGTVTIVERPDADLAVVTVSGTHRWSGHRFGGRRYDGVHPMALHNATDMGALLLVAGGSFRFTYRYESWVQLRSRTVRPRVDLAPLAGELGAADSVSWESDPIDGLTPELGPVGRAGSDLAPDSVVEAIVRHLTTAPPAFDPFARPA